MSAATLGFQIDSSQAAGAAANLDDLTASANRTTAAADKLGAEASALGTALGKTGRGANEAKGPVESLGRSFGAQDDHVRAFRMEVERLTAKYQPMVAATKSYEASVSEIERAHRMGILSATQMQRALDAERMAYERLKTSATTAGAAMKAANANAAPSGAQRAASANLGFQFQDIGVTAAMGMSPLMIGLQQGTQLASVLGTMEKPITGLAAAFGSLINPVSLITIGLTAGTAALIQYFMTSDEGSGKMNADLKAQNDLIIEVADRWGDATPKLKAYADELVKAAEARERFAAADAAASTTTTTVVDVLAGANAQYTAAIRELRGGGEETASSVRQITKAFTDLQSGIMDGTATMDQVKAAQDALATGVDKYGTPAIINFASAFDTLLPRLREAVARAAELRGEATALSGLEMMQRYPSRGTYGGVIRSPDFTIQNLDMLPETGPIPRPRPNIELAGDGSAPGAPMILNSDGRLVPVPTPGARPNYFEQEALQPAFNSTRTGANAWDRSILLEEARRNEMGSMFKGFITDFGSVLRESGGDLGKALMESFSNAMMNAASQAWDKFASLASTAIVNLIMGQPSAGLMNKGIGFTGANTNLSNLLGVGPGLTAANQNVAGMASVNGVQGQVWNYFAGKGLAPHQIAGIMGNVSAESGFNPSAVGDNGKAFGLFQHWGNRGGSPSMLGNTQAQLDLAWKELQTTESGAMSRLMSSTDVRGATAAFAGFERPQGFSLGNPEAAHNFVGRLSGAEEALAKFGGTTASATQGLGQLGNGLGQMGNTLAQGATGAAGGGGGGLFGWLGGLFGGGGSSQWDLAASGKITGLFADGTDYAPGGLSVVGERGPELVNLPEGARVFSNHKSMDMMRGGGNQRNGNMRPILNVVVQGGSGDEHVRELARQGAQEVLGLYDQNQTRGGFGQQQQNYAKRKG